MSTNRTHYTLLVLGTLILANSNVDSQTTYPEYSQQCRDDAGPPFVDDGTWTYHENNQATPVLMSDGSCAPKMQTACVARDNPKLAYIEGPPDCGGNGWYCRILVQDGWDPIWLVDDLNFGYCNTTEGFYEPWYDQSGHCHGSDNDSTYYWWVRDHWFRQYNGRLRCCCNWDAEDNPLTAGKVANRCDFRRLVVDEDDAARCRDANEGHGQSFEGGCTGPAVLDQPLDEDDSMCWELHHFGYSEETGSPPPTPSPTKSVTRAPTISHSPTKTPSQKPVKTRPTKPPKNGSGPTNPPFNKPTKPPKKKIMSIRCLQNLLRESFGGAE